jgi:hypothetical protein
MLLLIQAKKRELQAAQGFVASELEEDAILVKRYYEQQWSMQNVRDSLLVSDWERYKGTLTVIEKKDPELWRDLQGAALRLSRTMRHGADPPRGDELRNLAACLRSFRY